MNFPVQLIQQLKQEELATGPFLVGHRLPRTAGHSTPVIRSPSILGGRMQMWLFSL